MSPRESRPAGAASETAGRLSEDHATAPLGFQPMPELTADEYDALKRDIAARGVLVPVVVDQHGRLLDGHHRRRAADELGLECPVEVHVVADDDEALDLAVTLNAARRHLTQEQKRTVVRAELVRRPGDSDRAIARRVGCSPTTVGTVRAEWRAEAEASTRRAREAMRLTAQQMTSAVSGLVHLGADLADLIRRAEIARDAAEAECLARRDAGHGAVSVAAALTDHWLWSVLVNDWSDIHRDLQELGWSQDQMPLQVPRHELDELVDDLFRVSNLDTSTSAVAR